MDINAGTIVVGIDGSASSNRALAWAADQAVAEHRALTLVHAIHLVVTAMDNVVLYSEDVRSDLRAGGLALLAEARAEVERRTPGVEVHEVFQFADPRELLLELSRDAAMVVLGSRGRGRLRSLLLGSVGVAVIRHAHCPVVVNRPGNAGVVRRGVLVGADGTAESQAVLDFAYRQAALRDLPLTVLHCFWDVLAATTAAHAVGRSALEGATLDHETERRMLAESMAGLGEKYPEVRVQTELARGLPQEALLALGERMDLVVVGAHQGGLGERMLVGSVSVAVAVVEHAICPVAVVPLAS